MSIPKEKEFEKIYSSKERTIDYLLINEVLYKYNECPNCKRGKLYRCSSDKTYWRCNYYKCQKKISIFKNSFFAKTKIKVNDLLRICYKWICGQKYSDILVQTQHSTKTVSSMTRYCRELVAKNIEEEDNLIGGPNIIVEVDESKFGKVKYGHGHRVDGVWVLGAVERTKERKIFLKSVPDRKRDTLMKILGESIAAGSIVQTDLFKGYVNMEEYLDVSHKQVNHSINFKDPESGVHTNTIEGTWFGVKYKIAPRNRTKSLIDEHLAEFIWRRQNKERLWDAFMECLKNTKYI